MSWKDYEIYIHRHFQKQFPNSKISHNVRKRGIISNRNRQIDILIEGKYAGFDLNIVIDCKCFNKKIGINQVESFLSFLQDLKVSKGVMITNVGYTKPAYERATYDTQDIELRIIRYDDLHRFQNFLAIPYAGRFCAFITAPDGWVIDNNPLGKYLASLYPMGLSQQEAAKTDGFIYVLISIKDQNIPNLDSLLKIHDENIMNLFPKAKIEYFEEKIRDDCKTLLRTSDIHEGYKGLEYTLFLDYDEFTLFFVLWEPKYKLGQYIKKLKWIGEKVIPGKIIYDKQNKPLCIFLNQPIKKGSGA